MHTQMKVTTCQGQWFVLRHCVACLFVDILWYMFKFIQISSLSYTYCLQFYFCQLFSLQKQLACDTGPEKLFTKDSINYSDKKQSFTKMSFTFGYFDIHDIVNELK